MDRALIKQRAKAVRRRIKDKKLDGLIVTGVENVRYLTGFRGHDSWALVLPRSVVLITDSRYTEQAHTECLNCRIIERTGPLSKTLDAVMAAHKSVATLGLEDSSPIATLNRLRKTLSVRIKPVSGVVEQTRQIKTDEEIRLIKRAGKIAFDAMDWALSQLEVGITECQIAALYDYRLNACGASPGFETIVAFGPNGSRNHHQPGSRRLRKNDTVLVDFGAIHDGYTSDTTRCFAVGKPSDYYCRVYQTVARAQEIAIDTIAAGVKGWQVDAAARRVIREAGFEVYGHGTGHGLGLQVHELPTLAGADKKTTLQSGQVVTIEPGIYLPGRFGVRLEDDILVTDNGAKILSRDKRFDIDKDIIPIYLAKP